MRRWLGISILAVILSGCGPLLREMTPSPQLYSLDGVKLLVQGIQTTEDSSTFGQANYSVSPTRHLLLRFEALMSQAGRVDIDSGKKMQVQIAVSDPIQLAAATAALELCPITRSWMMLASWSLAHPFGQEGQWTQPGGDYDAAECSHGVPVAGDSTQRVLSFDVTPWYVDYVRGRGVNYGLILLSAVDISVTGETSGSLSPRILFDGFPVPDSSGAPSIWH